MSSSERWTRESDAKASRRARPITDRQLEILRHVARGLTNRAIGEELGISERTVRNHMRAILKRMSSSDRTHAVVLAIGRGWIPIPIEPDVIDSPAPPVGDPMRSPARS